MRIIVGVSGASGVYMAYRLLEVLKNDKDVETHLIVTEGAKRNLAYETELSLAEFEKMADFIYDEANMAVPIASGSFMTDGIIVIPCSMKTLSAISHGYAENLLIRAVDVCLKENRKVILVPREMPFNKIHLKNMLKAADAGCHIVPPMLTFYNQSNTLGEQVEHVIGKVLMSFNKKLETFRRWGGKWEKS